MRLPGLYPGGTFHWLIWDRPEGHVAPMLFAIYLVWGLFFFLAANNPLKYESFLTFTMWANLVHGLLMVPMALFDTSHMYHSKFLTDIPFILGLSAGIYLLRPKSGTKSFLDGTSR
jgi:FtsH-binding integral membrane protein